MRYQMQLHYIDAVARVGSIRGAAETLAITSTALNRRILAMEEELGVPIFERLPRGVRLSTAGEILIAHIRAQISDMERVRSQIADLSGARRGRVSLACSQALLPFFLPEQIAEYRGAHPAVTFGVHLRDRDKAERALTDFSADLALVFEPVRFGEFATLMTVRQPVCAVMAQDHPLAVDIDTPLRLRDCADFPLGMPTAPFGVRHLLDGALERISARLTPTVESDSFDFLRNYPRAEKMVSFQVPIGLPPPEQVSGIVWRRIDIRDMPEGLLHLGQLRGRTLPVAAAKFADQVGRVLQDRYG